MAKQSKFSTYWDAGNRAVIVFKAGWRLGIRVGGETPNGVGKTWIGRGWWETGDYSAGLTPTYEERKAAILRAVAFRKREGMAV